MYAALSIDQLHKLLLHLFCPFAGPADTKTLRFSCFFKQRSVMINISTFPSSFISLFAFTVKINLAQK